MTIVWAPTSLDLKRLETGDPLLRERFLPLAAEYAVEMMPWSLKVTSVARSQRVQEALWAQGRIALSTVNTLRQIAGLPPITEQENQRAVTWTRSSQHTLVPSRAVDVVATMDPDGPEGPLKPVIEYEDESLYRPLGALARRHGLVWGGTFKKPDLCHLELPRKAA